MPLCYLITTALVEELPRKQIEYGLTWELHLQEAKNEGWLNNVCQLSFSDLVQSEDDTSIQRKDQKPITQNQKRAKKQKKGQEKDKMTTELLIFGTWRRGQNYFQKIWYRCVYCLDTNPSLNNYESLISLNLLCIFNFDKHYFLLLVAFKHCWIWNKCQ